MYVAPFCKGSVQVCICMFAYTYKCKTYVLIYVYVVWAFLYINIYVYISVTQRQAIYILIDKKTFNFIIQLSLFICLVFSIHQCSLNNNENLDRI